MYIQMIHKESDTSLMYFLEIQEEVDTHLRNH